MNGKNAPYQPREKEQITEEEKEARRKITDEFQAFIDRMKIQGNVTTPHYDGTRGYVKVELYIPPMKLREIFRF